MDFSDRTKIPDRNGKLCWKNPDHTAAFRFIRTLGLEISGIHGGYIPFGLREPVVDNLFMVGDSAGMARQ